MLGVPDPAWPSRQLAHELILRREATGAGADDLLFTAERGGRIIPRNLMGRVMKAAAVRAGLGEWVGERDSRGRVIIDRRSGQPRKRAVSWVGFHSFRHTCATLLFLSGWNAKQVSTFLGHEDAGFTLRTYVWVLGEDLPSPTFGSWDTPTPAPAEAGTARVGQLVGETRTPETARNGLALVEAEDGSDSAIVSGRLAVVGASR